jgi:hypothetical protein
MSNISKAIKLQEAIDKLHEADVLIQEAIGASDECYDLHCAIGGVVDDIAEYAEQLVEMQITE